MEKWYNQSRFGKRPLEIIYMAGDGTITHRIIRVMEHDQNRVLAYCYQKKQVRSFNKDRILSVLPYTNKQNGRTYNV